MRHPLPVLLLPWISVPFPAHVELPETLAKTAEAFHRAYAESLQELWSRHGENQRQEIHQARQTLEELRAKPDLSRADLSGPGHEAFATLRELLLPSVSWMRRHFRDFHRAEGRLKAQKNRFRAFAREHELSYRFSQWVQLQEALGQIRAFHPDDYGRLWRSVQESLAAAHPDELRNILDLNVLRGLQDLPAIPTVDPGLVEAARDHSDDMQRLGFFSHTSPIEEKETVRLRARRFDTRASGENLHRGQPDPIVANQSWCKSPGHFKTMFMPGWQRIGVGHVAAHWTAMFGR